MSRVPDGWKSAALGEVCRIVSGSTPKTSRADYWGGDVKWITPNDLSKDRSQVTHCGARSLTTAGYEACSARLFPPGSVIVSSRAPIGYVTIAGSEMCTNQGCKTAVPPDFVDSRYLYWFLINVKPDLEARASGTTFKEISGKRFAETRFWWPPLDEQRRIVEILEDHLSRLDAAESQLVSAADHLDVVQASLLNGVLRECASLARLRMSELAVDARYGTSAKCVLDGPGMAVVRIPNLVNGSVDLTDEKRLRDVSVDLSSVMLRAGDLLIVRTNGSRDLIGRTAVVQPGIDAAFASYLIRYRLAESRVRPEWVHLVLRAPASRTQLESLAASSAGQYNLSLGKLNQVSVPVPRLEVQDEFVSNVATVEGQLNRLRGSIDSSIQRREVLRAALLAAAFAGRLTGRASDDEVVPELAGV